MRPYALLLATLTTGFTAEGNVAVDTTPLSVTVGRDAVASAVLTVRNTGDAPLTLRLRDTGSGTGGTAVPATILATYGLSSWIDGTNGTGYTLYRTIAFDGLNLWRYNATSKKFVATRLEDGTITRQVTPTGTTMPLFYAPVWDGDSFWIGSAPPSGDLSRQVFRFSSLPADAGALLRTVTLPNRTSTSQGWGCTPAHDPAQGLVWGIDAFYAARIEAASGAFLQQTTLQGTSYSQTGVTWYDGDIWYTRGAGDKTKIARRDCLTGTVEATYAVLPAAEVDYGVYSMVADGWGRFVIITAPTKANLYATHVDSGLRGWLTCAEATHRAVTIPAGGQTSFTLRCDARAAGIGTHTSRVLVDSDDPQTPRLGVPVQFTVEDRNADAPLARADAYASTWDAVLAVAAPGVLGNDDGDQPLSAALVSGPEHGVLNLNADGSFTYDATDGYVGDDAFSYRTTDGQGRQSAIVTATIAVDHAPIPEIQISPTAIAATAAPGGTASVDLTIANIGYGTLTAALSDPGTGGVPGTVVRETEVPTLGYRTAGVQIALAGDSCWALDILWNPTQVRRTSLVTGAVQQTLTLNLPNLPADSIAWDGTRLWVAERSETAVDASGAIYHVRDPRVFVIDPGTGAQVGVVSFPKPAVGQGWNPKLAADDAGGIWLVNPYQATWRIDTATLVKTSKPKISAYVTAITWYAGSLWIKDRPTINRYDPETGAKIAGHSFTWTGSDDYDKYNGFASAGFGRFWLCGGPEGSPILVRVDSGMRGWLRATPTTVSVGRQSTAIIRLDLVADLAGPGTHQVTVTVFSNDATDPVLELPVTFTVSAATRAIGLRLLAGTTPLSATVRLDGVTEALHGSGPGETSPVVFPDLARSAAHTLDFPPTAPSANQ